MLNELQRKIICCKPEVDKPVFILVGVGSGKTYALNERAKLVEFLYYSQYTAPQTMHENLIYGTDIDKFDEIVFEQNAASQKDLILPLIGKKKLIVCVTPAIFIEQFVSNIQGEMTIITGYNMYHNEYLDVRYEKEVIMVSEREKFLGLWHV